MSEDLNQIYCRRSLDMNANVQNIRKVKMDVLRAAKNMYSNVVLNKKSSGRSEVRLVLTDRNQVTIGLPSLTSSCCNI